MIGMSKGGIVMISSLSNVVFALYMIGALE